MVIKGVGQPRTYPILFAQYGNKGCGSTSYLSHSICDEIIHIMANMVMEVIIEEVQQAEHTSRYLWIQHLILLTQINSAERVGVCLLFHYYFFICAVLNECTKLRG